MNDTPIEDPGATPPGLDGTVRFLKILVTTLTVTTIVGLIVLISVIVMRVQEMGAIPLPDRITLPESSTAVAFTQGGDWYAVVTGDDRILIFDRASGDLRQTITVAPQN